MEQKKDKRRHLILQILRKQNLNTQEELVGELADRGIRVTQATLSRDLAQIGAVRVSHPEGARYQLPADPAGARRQVVPSQVLGIEWNETAVLVKTLSGCAPSVSAVIDSWNQPDILGTVSGDDTILVIPKSIKRVQRVAQALEKAIFSAR
jgi:transcriptional regulator of arginine metabolism